jgi:hypothetical protein
MRRFAVLFLSLSLFTLPALAAEEHHHQAPALPAIPKPPTPPGLPGAVKVEDKRAASTKDFEAANEKMHLDMSITYTGKADVDFVKGMIPHHQGAIDMAKVELKYGKDPELKKLATDIIAAQEKEIAGMKAWLAKNDK